MLLRETINSIRYPDRQSLRVETKLWIALAALLCWTLVFLIELRAHFLDDAFIHLRYAHNLLDLHKITYNGDSSDFGTSSLGYTLILAIGSLLTNDPFLPKLINVVFYALFWLFLARAAYSTGGLQRSVIAGALVLISTPFAMRWMTDGMESVVVVVMGSILGTISARPNFPAMRTASITLAAVLLRVEFLYVAGLASLARIIADWRRHRDLPPTQWLTVGHFAPLAGGIAGLAIVFAVFHHILPDTAIAKRSPPGSDLHVLQVLQSVFHAHLGASLFGVGLFLLWIGSFGMAWRHASPAVRLSVITVNLGWPVFVALVAISQQHLQGIRYFFFLYSFLISWNASTIPSVNYMFDWRWLSLSGVVFIAWFLFDVHLVTDLARGRSATLHTFHDFNLSPLSGQRGIAWDIGFIGYFSNGYILDVNGLVNGRDSAQLSEEGRLKQYSKEPFAFIFANKRQLSQLSPLAGISGWTCVLHADFPNASGDPDRHWLLVRPDLGQSILRINKVVALQDCGL